MWILPSFGRPDSLRKLAGCPGGMPPIVTLLVNDDDPAKARYMAAGREFWLEGSVPQWDIVVVPMGSRCADAHRFAFTHCPDEKFYGLICDDQWPVTPGWWRAMELAAEDRYVVAPAGEPSFPLCRTAVCLGGNLVRTMGTLVPALVRHNFEDNCWDTIAADFGLLRALPQVVVEHRHHIRGQAAYDETYRRGSADFEEDARIFQGWLLSAEREQMNRRIKELLK